MRRMENVILFGSLESLPRVEEGLVGAPQAPAQASHPLQVEVERNGLDAATVARLVQSCLDGSCQWCEPPEEIRGALAKHKDDQQWAIAIWLDRSNGNIVYCACTPEQLRDFVLIDELLDEAQQAAFRAFARKQAARLAKENPY